MKKFSYEKYIEIADKIKEVSDIVSKAENGQQCSFKIEDAACRLISLGNSLRMHIMHSNKR